MRVRPEVAHPLAPRPAVDEQPGEFLVERDGQHRVGLVVAVTDVEARIEFLDPVVLELQRLDLGVDDGPLHLGGGGDHLPGARVQTRDIGEVRREAAAQALGLADVDDPAVLIGEPVDTRLDRDGSRGGAVGRRIRHCSSLVPPRDCSRRASYRPA